MFSASKSAAPSGKTYVEDVFSTYLYTGTGATQTITNGIDLAGKGGLVWVKGRSGGSADNHLLLDTVRGVNRNLRSNETVGQYTETTVTSFNSNGFSTTFNNGDVNLTGHTYASWTFRKQPKFFDMVTYTGNGTTQTISHNLGATPGCIIVKCTSTSSNWAVYHRGQSSASYYTKLNLTDAQASDSTVWNGTDPTSSVFSIGTSSLTNTNGATYVAYLFAHNAGGFGLTGTDNVISCGSYVGTGSAGKIVTLGWEPQFLLAKNASADDTYGWFLLDTMRGIPNSFATDNSAYLLANTSSAETKLDLLCPTSTGFYINRAGNPLNSNNQTYIYIAIRRGPMQVPTDGTKVFAPWAQTGEAAFNNSFPVDLVMERDRTSSAFGYTADRLRGGDPTLSTTSTAAEFSAGPAYFDSASGTFRATFVGGASPSVVYENFGRAPGFFDVVCYTGTGSEPSVQNHNLGVTPELMIIKSRSASASWLVYSNFTSSSYNWGVLQTTNAFTNSPYGTGERMYAQPTSTTFTLSNYSVVNASGGTYVAYLFATCPGVSKVGSYTGNGSSQTLNCGFTAGARFVLIKRTNSTGDWYVWDTARGIVAANDPHLSLNTTNTEVTTDDSIDPDSTGFIVNQVAATNINVTSATYIYLAIA